MTKKQKLIRVTQYIWAPQYEWLKSQPESDAYHLREALKQYIKSKEKQK